MDMKIKFAELIIAIILSVAAWTIISTMSVPLNSTETTLVVGVILIVVYTIGFLIRRSRRKKP